MSQRIYVVETPEAFFEWTTDEVEEITFPDGDVQVACYDPDSSQRFAAGAWTRFYLRTEE